MYTLEKETEVFHVITLDSNVFTLGKAVRHRRYWINYLSFELHIGNHHDWLPSRMHLVFLSNGILETFITKF